MMLSKKEESEHNYRQLLPGVKAWINAHYTLVIQGAGG